METLKEAKKRFDEDNFLRKGVRPKTMREYWRVNIDRYIASIFYLIIMPALMVVSAYKLDLSMRVEVSLIVVGFVMGIYMSIGIYTMWFEKGIKEKLKQERKK